MAHIKNIIFDLGGVLIDWNPRYLFTEVFESDTEMDYFLTEICSPAWNEEQDGGRSLEEGTRILVNKHPEYASQIRLFYGQWPKMLGGSIDSNVRLLRQLIASDRYGIFALTNWSAETFPTALELYDFLHEFEGILVSGVEKLKKPDPAIYHLMLDRYDLDANSTLFIDDNLRNVKAASNIGIQGVHYTDDRSLQKALKQYGVL